MTEHEKQIITDFLFRLSNNSLEIQAIKDEMLMNNRLRGRIIDLENFAQQAKKTLRILGIKLCELEEEDD